MRVCVCVCVCVSVCLCVFVCLCACVLVSCGEARLMARLGSALVDRRKMWAGNAIIRERNAIIRIEERKGEDRSGGDRKIAVLWGLSGPWES
jgi:hypothetical protein